MLSDAAQRAQTLMTMHRHEQAVEVLLEAITVNPNDALCHAILARCLVNIDRPNMALKHAGTAVSLQPDNSYCLYILGWIHHRRNENTVARETMMTALTLDPTDPDIYVVLADIERMEDNDDACYRHIEKALALDPESVDALRVKAIALWGNKRYKEATKVIEAGLLVDPEDEDLQFLLGKARLKFNDREGAEAMLSESLRRDPTNKKAQMNIAALRAKVRWYHWPILPIVGPLMLVQRDAAQRSQVILSNFAILMLLGSILAIVLQVFGHSVADPSLVKPKQAGAMMAWGAYTLTTAIMTCGVAMAMLPLRAQQRKRGEDLPRLAPNRMIYRILIPVAACIAVCGIVSLATWGSLGLLHMSGWVLPALPALFIVVTQPQRHRIMAGVATLLAVGAAATCIVTNTSLPSVAADITATDDYTLYDIYIRVAGVVIMASMLILENALPDRESLRR